MTSRSDECDTSSPRTRACSRRSGCCASRVPAAIGELLDASHRSLRNDFEVSVAELDLAVETAQSNGAIGARMTGGGFGGSAIALVPSDAISQVVRSVADAFAEHGFGGPDIFSVTPSDGARRDPH